MNHRFPSHETPLKPGVKKDSCFRRVGPARIWKSAVIMIRLCKELLVSADVNGGGLKPNFAVVQNLKLL